MAQQTRKDPRAKVLSMTVRYKSATLDEFIEHHSHDVSRGGMFIKTPQPFPPGTLLKFEVRIAEDRKVMQGVGRVVWKRDGSASDLERPSGMGVKFIKLDDESRALIDQLLSARHDESSAFDSGGDVDAEAKLGLGLSSHGSESSERDRAAASATSFFPKMEPAELPPPEDRTVMKQAAELLEEALREVGTEDKPVAPHASASTGRAAPGSLAPAEDENEETKPGRPSRSDESVARLPTPKLRDSAKVQIAERESGPASNKNADKNALNVASAGKFVASAKAATSSLAPNSPGKATPSSPGHPPPTRPDSPKPLASDRVVSAPKMTSKPVPATATVQADKSGSGRGLIWLAAVAASVGVIYWVTRPKTVLAPQPENIPAETTTSTPQASEEPRTVSPASAATVAAPSVEASAATAEPAPVAPSTQAVPSTEPSAPTIAEAKAPAEVSAAPAEATPKLAKPPASPVAPKAVVAKPKTQAAETTPPSVPAEPAPAEPAPAAPKPEPAVKPEPAEPKAPPPSAEPKMPAEPATPKPAAPKKAKATESDNPY